MKKKKDVLSAEHLLYLRRLRRKSIFVNIARFGVLALIIGLWELCAQLKLIDPFITSSPSRVARTVYELYSGGNLFYHIGITLAETLIGFFIAVILGYGVAPHFAVTAACALSFLPR